MPGPKPKTTALFIQQAQDVHNGAYKYSTAEYINVNTKLLVTCPAHGNFSITPSNHLGGRGCPACAKITVGAKNATRGKRLFAKTTEQFITESKNKHGDRYDYTQVIYQNNYTKLDIVCSEHGVFRQTADHHLRGSGCPSCAHTSKHSAKGTAWLNEIMEAKGIFIQHAGNVGEYHIPNTRYSVDGYCAATNTVYEFHGDRWHGNPAVFDSADKCHPYDNTITAGELYHKTTSRENDIRNLGYNLVVMWEQDLKQKRIVT